MSAIGYIVLGITLCATLRALTRPKKRDPMEGRLVPRTGFQPLPMQQEAIREILRRERDARDDYANKRYREELAKMRAKFDREEPTLKLENRHE